MENTRLCYIRMLCNANVELICIFRQKAESKKVEKTNKKMELFAINKTFQKLILIHRTQKYLQTQRCVSALKITSRI